MGVHVLEGVYDGGPVKAVLVDSVTGFAFGPLFEDAEEADGFLAWLPGNARALNDEALAAKVQEYRSRPEEENDDEDDE